MRIAVDARLLQAGAANRPGDFTSEVVLRLINAYQSHQFILFANAGTNPLINLPANVSFVIITPRPTNVLLYKWWYDVRVPFALRKYKADVFICANGLCSGTTDIPQLLIINDLAFLQDPAHSSTQHANLHKKATPRSLKKTSLIVTFSEFIKKKIAGAYDVSPQKIATVSPAANSSFKPLNWQDREDIKEKYAGGCEYLIFTGGLNPVQNLINILKAFSIFKKWQRTNMKLVVTVNLHQYKDYAEKLNSYKYKNEIIIVENLIISDLAKLTAGAYAIIFLPLYEEVATPVLNAMQCEVPVITSTNSSMAELAGDAGLYCNPANHEEIADQMKMIFKDEQFRNKLIAAGRERIKEFSWNKTITSAWQLIEKTVSR